MSALTPGQPEPSDSMAAPVPSPHTVRDVLRERVIAGDLDPRAVDDVARDLIRRYAPAPTPLGFRRRRRRGTTEDRPAQSLLRQRARQRSGWGWKEKGARAWLWKDTLGGVTS
jgi:hypothetical protein